MNKSSVLWNIVEPGDPYDIRKSMIAKLPNHPSRFMGQHLELVCLLQAAQIQRICEYLDEYKLHYKQITRKELDRHSYEVQIKELTEKILQLQSYVTENEKLKDFIKRQSIELEEEKKKRQSSLQMSGIQAKYDSLLIELKNMRQKNFELEKSNVAIVAELLEWKQKYQISERNKLLQISTERQRLQSNFRQRIESQITQITHKFESRIILLQNQAKLHRDQLDTKNHEIQSLQNKKQNLMKQIYSLEMQIKSKTQMEGDYYRKSHQLQEINKILNEKTLKLQAIFLNYQNIQNQNKKLTLYIATLEKERDEYIQQIDQLKQIIDNNKQYDRLQNKMVMLSTELQRLTQLLRTKSTQYNQILNKYNQAISENRRLQSQKVNYMRLNSQYLENIRTLQMRLSLKNESENAIKSLNLQIERLKGNLQIKSQQITTLQQRIYLYQNNNKQLISLKANLNDKQKIISELRYQISQLNRKNQEKIQSYENRIVIYENSTKEINNLKTIIGERQKIISDLKYQINQGNKKNQEWLRKIKILQQKIYSYEGSMPRLSQEIERYKMIVQSKSQQLERQRNQNVLLKQKILEVSSERIQIEIRKRVQIYESKVSVLENQIKNSKGQQELMRRKLNDLQREKYQNEQSWYLQRQKINTQNIRLKQIYGDLQKQYNLIKNTSMNNQKIEIQIKKRLQIYQTKISAIQRQNRQLRALQDTLRKKNNDQENQKNQIHLLYTKEKEQMFLRIRNYQAIQIRISSLQEENRNLKQSQERLKKRLGEMQRDYDTIKRQLQIKDSRIFTLEQQRGQNSNKINSQNRELLEKIKRIEAQLNLKLNSQSKWTIQRNNLYRQIENLKRQLDIKENQLKQINHQTLQHTKIIQQNQSLIERIKRLQGELNFKLSLQSKWTTERNAMIIDIEALRRENTELNQIAHELQNKYHQLEYQNNNRSNATLEIQRLNLRLRQKSEQIDRERQNINRYANLVRERQMQMRDYENKLVLTTQQIERLTIILYQLQNNPTSNGQSRQQYDRLMETYRIKCEEILQWQQKYTTLYKTYREMEQSHSRMYSQHQNTKRILIQYQNKIQQLQREFETLNKILHQLNAQNQRLRNDRGQLSQLEMKNRQLAFEIDRLNKVITQMKKQIQEMRLKMTDDFALQRRVEEHMALMVILFAEIQTLRRRVKDTEQQCENVRRSSLSPFKVQ